MYLLYRVWCEKVEVWCFWSSRFFRRSITLFEDKGKLFELFYTFFNISISGDFYDLVKGFFIFYAQGDFLSVPLFFIFMVVALFDQGNFFEMRGTFQRPKSRHTTAFQDHGPLLFRSQALFSDHDHAFLIFSSVAFSRISIAHLQRSRNTTHS